MSKPVSSMKWYSIYLTNKKVFFLSKFVIVGCLMAYIISSAFTGWLRDGLFLFLLVALILVWDAILKKIISQPILEISKAAHRMANLNFSKPCPINTKDELGKLANDLNTTAANLEHSLAQRKDLTDSLSHELKTPLGVIRAYAEGLESADPEQEVMYRQTIIEETEKMSELVNTLLDLSALEAGAAKLTTESFDLVELVEIVAGREFIDSSTKSFHLNYSLPDTPIYIVADCNRIQQVLHNFMSNAKKFVTKNGEISIEMIELDGFVRFSIYNDGPLVVDEVWKRFHRTRGSENNNGSGLGLTIASQILTMHQVDFGFINQDTGVSFYFIFPIS